ncbi:MAG: tRNA (guanosine(46)-N7)-methyltransferase TrmB, partial [Candidatus Omnitrophica bacterium]|nr:tRNA (guanosine(46)-N7)-methyltransferase TrmB [Candidatus Omnitrophota bacterium]
MIPASIEIKNAVSNGPLHWPTVFRGSENPVEVEVGCGKGRFLIGRAQDNPDRNFLGLEYAKAYSRAIADRSIRKGLTNIRVVRAEGADFFRRFVPDHSLSGFHLLYPDPWPKNRHHRRRLLQTEFIVELRRPLKREAIINIATDHRDYYEWMCRHFDQWPATFVLEKRIVSEGEELRKLEGRTNYERKFIEEGRPLHFITG